MRSTIRERIAAVLLASLLGTSVPAQQQQQPQATPQKPSEPGFRMRVTTEIVLVNVIARDKKGNLIRDLKQSDFTVYEDGQKQQVSSFDFENVDALQTAGEAGETITGAAGNAGSLLGTTQAASLEARDRRLMLMFFDFSAMQPEDIDRAVEAGKKYVQANMQPADMVALVSLATNMNLDLDFSTDKQKILSVLSSYNGTEGQGFENGTTGSSEGAAETSGSYSADDTDYNTFSADRKLLALQSIMQAMGKIPQKKSLIYFSNGISQSGVDNQSALRATTAAAVKANVSIYPVDVRGLSAFPPGGQAQSASLHGQSAYSGASVLNDLNSNAASQETLYTLADDTGGKAFMDTNDFSGVFKQVQKDTSAYYVLGYTSTNRLKDGRFRRLKVQVNRADVKLEYRPGYYAGRDFEHMKQADREQQLDDELMAELPQTDVAVYAGTAYFRQDESHYYLAISLVIPGSQIPFVQEKDKDSATIDIIGVVLESGKFPMGRQRDTVKLAVDSTRQVRQKNVQYNTGFVLPPGNYHLKFIVRENRSGRMGSFETDVRIPDLRKAPLRMSSVVLSSQRVPVAEKKQSGFQPLITEQTQLVPSVTHVFRQDQKLYLQYEVYDAAKAKAAEAKNGHATVRVLTSIEFLQGDLKVYETKPILAQEITAPDRKAVTFQVEIPLEGLKPGFYTCQVNIIDDVAGNYAFPRWPILVKPTTEASTAGAPAASR
ncbi:MAG TPA: VWA domain-containing protein [Candidatus Saccharimonadales bacterium]|nr:VWA domain-containing protein [Candidatus Saccharimonadales bacterium]